MKKLFVSFIAALFAFALTATASAEGAPASASQAGNVPDSTLKVFVAAEQEVSVIREDFQQRIGAEASSQEQAMQMQQRAQEKMIDAVENAGLDVQTYNQIAQLASTDEQLRERIESMR